MAIDRESLDAVVCGIFRRLGLDPEFSDPEVKPADFLHTSIVAGDEGYKQSLEAYDHVKIVVPFLTSAIVAAIENPLAVEIAPMKAALNRARKEIARVRAKYDRESKTSERASAA